MINFFKNNNKKSTNKSSESLTEDEWVTEIKDNKIINEESEQFEIDYLPEKDKIDYGTKVGLSIEHIKILKKCKQESSALELMDILNRTNKSKFKLAIINPLVEQGFLQLKFPDKPKSPRQRYRLTNKFVMPNKG